MTYRSSYLRAALRCALAAGVFLASQPVFASGELDAGFGSGGKVVADLGGSNEHPNAIVRDAAGNLYLAGGSGSGSTSDFAVLKLDASGAPVAGFGDGGKVIVDMGGPDGANAIARDASGNLFVCGSSGDGGVADYAVIKLDANGDPVAAFGTQGKVTIDLGGSDHCASVLLDGAGNVYLVGGSSAYAGAAVVAKLDAAGHLVSSYGTAGIGAAQMSTDTASIATMDSQGRIVATGFRSFGAVGGGQLTATRIDATGHQDSSFGTSGVTEIYLDDGDRTTETSPGGITLDGAGNIYIAGYTDVSQASDYDLVVFKLDANGHLVPGFGNAGVSVVALADTDEFGASIAVDSSGRIYAGGTLQGDEIADFLAVAMDANGDLIADFGSGGVATVDFGGSEFSSSLTLSSDRLYLAGATYGGGAYDFAAAALTIDSTDAVFINGFDFQ